MLLIHEKKVIYARVTAIFPYEVPVDSFNTFNPCYSFCCENFGEDALEFLSPRYLWLSEDRQWASFRITNGFVFMFKNINDAILLKLNC